MQGVNFKKQRTIIEGQGRQVCLSVSLLNMVNLLG